MAGADWPSPYRREAPAGHSHRNDIQPTQLTSMDRVYLAIIVSALLLFLGAAGLYVTRTRGPHAARSHGRRLRHKIEQGEAIGLVEASLHQPAAVVASCL